MRLAVGADMVQARAQEGGGHNVHNDIMGDPCQAGAGWWGRQGAGQTEDSGSVPSQCLFTPLSFAQLPLSQAWL